MTPAYTNLMSNDMMGNVAHRFPRGAPTPHLPLAVGHHG